MSESYHATVSATQAQLHEYERKARNQEQAILNHLNESPGHFTCETLEALRVLPRGTPHSSYIRAIANLVKSGQLEKVRTTTGRYGRPINVYRRSQA